MWSDPSGYSRTAVPAEETEAQRMCVARPGPHRALGLQSAELPRLRPESLCLAACLTAWLPPLTAHFHTLQGTLFSTRAPLENKALK